MQTSAKARQHGGRKGACGLCCLSVKCQCKNARPAWTTVFSFCSIWVCRLSRMNEQTFQDFVDGARIPLLYSCFCCSSYSCQSYHLPPIQFVACGSFESPTSGGHAQHSNRVHLFACWFRGHAVQCAQRCRASLTAAEIESKVNLGVRRLGSLSFRCGGPTLKESFRGIWAALV